MSQEQTAVVEANAAYEEFRDLKPEVVGRNGDHWHRRSGIPQ